MPDSLLLLLLSAASIGFIHTIVGPDHYLPFIMMARAQQWSRAKLLRVTLLCGIGHVLGSVVLGAVGIAFGIALQRLEIIEGVRGDIAAWTLIAFGTVYAAWGLRHAWRKSEHTHPHAHEGGVVHAHEHGHLFGHRHSHAPSAKAVMTTWTLFTIFVLGPCEPLIPLLMYPAAEHDMTAVALVAAVFGLVTVATMLAAVWAASAGVARIRFDAVERFTHAIAGGVIACSGLAIQIFGL